MNKRLILWLLMLLVAAGAGLAYWQYPQPAKETDLQDMLDAPKTSMQMRLWSANRDRSGKSVSGRTLGFEHYEDGGRTLRHIRNFYEDGRSEDIYLRPDGSQETAVEYFPQKTGLESPAQIRSKAGFAADGKTYTMHQLFRENGKLERDGRLLETGFYQTSYFCGTSERVERLRLFDKDKKFHSEMYYSCLTGKLKAEIYPGRYHSESKVVLYREDGSKEADLLREYLALSGVVYAEDGKTPLFEFKTDHWGPQVKTLTPEGKVKAEWASSYGRIKYKSFNPESGQLLFEQEWRTETVIGREVPVKLYFFAEYGKDKKLVRKVEMDSTGKFPALVTSPLPDGIDLKSLTLPLLKDGDELGKLLPEAKLRKHLSPGGWLNKTELVLPGYDPVLQKDTGGTLVFPAQQFVMPDYPQFPEFDKKELGPERVYDYAGSEAPVPSYQSEYDYYP